MRISKSIKTEYSLLCDAADFLDHFSEEGVFISSSEGIIHASSAFTRMFGYASTDELKFKPAAMLYAEAEVSMYLNDRIQHEDLIIKQRVLFKRKDGTNFWGLLTQKRHVKNGNIFFGCIRDISDLLEAEKKLRTKEIEVEKLTMELDQFIYSASHDIRSPVSTILGIVNLMKLELKDELTEKYIGMMEICMGKLDYFIRELTVYAKNSKKSLDDAAVDFEPIIRNILRELKLHHPGLRMITTSFEMNNTHVFYSDPDRLRLILYNTIKNAADYSDKCKSTKMLSIRITTGPDKAMIEIFDNGVGIPAVHLPRVFDLFYKGTNASKGSGLGLYATREAVLKLRGVISIESNYGIGTTVKIDLPNSKKGRLVNRKKSMKSIVKKIPLQ